jgi:4'-phosphopantetheinyl transferase
MIRMAVVELYITDPTSESPAAWLGAAVAWLSPQERDRATRFTDARARAVHTTGWALMRLAVARSRSVEPREVTIVKEDSGRPRILGRPPRQGSISHSAGRVAVAVTAARLIGVDLEYRDRDTKRLLAIATRAFAPTEAERLLALPEQESAAEIIRYWTVKEALGKALGLNLMAALRTVVVEPAGAGLRLAALPAGPAIGEWSLHQYALGTGPATLTLALASPSAARPTLTHVSAEQLRTGEI